jgi:hypothetical protein
VSNIVAQIATVALQYGELARKQAEDEILAVCRDLLPASDVDAIETELESRARRERAGVGALRPLHVEHSRLRERRVGSGGALLPQPAVPAVEVRAQQPSHDGAA